MTTFRNVCCNVDCNFDCLFRPWNMYERDWFSSTMLDSPDWPEVASRLTNLEVVFPSCHISPPEGGTRLADGLTEAYSLPVADCTRLLDTCIALTQLKLRGAGIHGDFLSINCLVKHGTNLASISLQVMPVSPLSFKDSAFNSNYFRQKMDFSNHLIQSWNLHRSLNFIF